MNNKYLTFDSQASKELVKTVLRKNRLPTNINILMISRSFILYEDENNEITSKNFDNNIELFDNIKLIINDNYFKKAIEKIYINEIYVYSQKDYEYIMTNNNSSLKINVSIGFSKRMDNNDVIYNPIFSTLSEDEFYSLLQYLHDNNISCIQDNPIVAGEDNLMTIYQKYKVYQSIIENIKNISPETMLPYILENE